MTWVRNARNNFKARPEIWFFYGFLLTSTLSIRKVFFDYPVLGGFNEYNGTYLYLSDLLFLGIMAAWLFSILYNKNLNLSIKNFGTQRLPREAKLFHVEQFSFLRGGTFSVLFIPLILVAWSFISIKWSSNDSIALYRSVKLFEFYLLYLFLALNPKCSMWNILRNVFRIIIAIGLINAIIGVLQVIIQHSLGLFWLKESLISPDLPGVAKIVLGGAKYIRAYGFFPHPNILGGFLLVSIILTLNYNRIFNNQEDVPRLPREAKLFHMEQFGFLRGGTWISFVLVIQIVGELLTFSKSAILGLILAFVYMFHAAIVPRLPRETKMFPMEHFSFLWDETIKKAILLVIFLVLGIYLIHPDFSSIFTKSLVERLVYINISLNMIYGNFLTGIGSGQFVLEMQKYSSSLLLDWQFQPVHNVFLLIWSELGLVGFSLFVLFIWKMFHPSRNVPQGTFENSHDLQTTFKALLIGFFVIALFDHYLWDIQQGQVMLWVMLGFLANTNIRNNLTK